ncbi:hypothetical protein CTA1_2826 [Colletotrichum tanaceti]|uniref:Uncharacterized protein n=1 Tax=Colletotrichum tanaceti TaxID=1306861 RepID=A0A4U6X978_9PEZI|nr:hypothetical protein CTA1_2826 [Colletotrichum tanaceti]
MSQQEGGRWRRRCFTDVVTVRMLGEPAVHCAYRLHIRPARRTVQGNGWKEYNGYKVGEAEG